MFPGLYGKNAPWEKFLKFIQALRNIRKEIHESGPMKLFFARVLFVYERSNCDNSFSDSFLKNTLHYASATRV